MTVLHVFNSRFYLAIIVFSFAVTNIQAQEGSLITQHVEIHTNPLTFAYYTPSYRLGVEYVKNRFGYILEYGFGNTTLNGFRYNGTNGNEVIITFITTSEEK